MGLGKDVSLASVSAVLGDEGCVDDVHKKRHWLRRDYGLVEFGFNSDPVVEWSSYTVILAVHRLPYETPVPEPILNLVREIPRSISSDELMTALEGRGVCVEKSAVGFRDFVHYSVPSSGASITVLTDEDCALPTNSVWSITVW